LIPLQKASKLIKYKRKLSILQHTSPSHERGLFDAAENYGGTATVLPSPQPSPTGEGARILTNFEFLKKMQPSKDSFQTGI